MPRRTQRSKKKTKEEDGNESAEEVQKVEDDEAEEVENAASGDEEMNDEAEEQENGPQKKGKATKKGRGKKVEEEEEAMEVAEDAEDEPTGGRKRKRTDSEGTKEKQAKIEEEEEDEEEKKKREEEEEAERKKKEEEEAERKKKEEEERKVEEEKRKAEEEKRREEEKKRKEEERKLAEERREQERIRKKKAELEKYWKPVKEDPTDFTGWTYLLQYVDQGAETEAAREAFDEFFHRYPYCYGYWKKYADFEKKKGSKENCEKVFDRGLEAIPLSVDLWIHYMNYLKSRCAEDEGIEDRIRTEYLRALDTCGLDFRASKLWEQYIKWETEKKNFQGIMAIYNRLLQTPTQMYSNHWTNFQKFVNSQHPKDLLSVDEFLSLRKEVLDEIRKQNATGELLPAGHDDEGEAAAPGDDDEPPPGEEDDEQQAKKSLVPDEEMVLLREKIIEQKKETHRLNEEEVSKRWTFEEGIKRPYFHVKPLEKGQLKNWREYLDFEMEAGDEPRIQVLFERCLIACAFYEEFWHKYIHYLMNKDDDKRLRNAFHRACTIHLPKKPALHLQWAAFEEKNSDYVASDKILATLEKNVPDLVQLAYRRINLARREGNKKKVHELYNGYLEKFKEDGSLTTHMTIKYARFCHKIDGSVEKAKTILQEGLEKVPSREKGRMYLQLVDLGFSEQPVNEEFIIANLDLALECAPTDQDRLLFSQRKVEFLEDFGTNVVALQNAIETHLKLLKTLREQETKRRAAEEEALQTNSDQVKSKKSSSTRSPTPQKAALQSSESSGGNSNNSWNQQYNQQNWNQYQQQYGQGWSYGGYYNQGWGYNYPPPANQNMSRR